MRPSNKSRSRNKNNNRNRSMGNVVSRVFDSAGPESKVRGTPQQIIEKYQMLARDAQLSGDRVAAENFLQHSEHYSRMLLEAQQEQAERQAAEAQSQPQQQQQQQQQPQQQQRGQQSDRDQSNVQPGQGEQPRTRHEKPRREAGLDVADTREPAKSDADLVETPEMQARPKTSRPRIRKPAAVETVSSEQNQNKEQAAE